MVAPLTVRTLAQEVFGPRAFDIVHENIAEATARIVLIARLAGRAEAELAARHDRVGVPKVVVTDRPPDAAVLDLEAASGARVAVARSEAECWRAGRRHGRPPRVDARVHARQSVYRDRGAKEGTGSGGAGSCTAPTESEPDHVTASGASDKVTDLGFAEAHGGDGHAIAIANLSLAGDSAPARR